MARFSDQHIEWLEQRLAQAEHRLDLAYGEALDLAAADDGWDDVEAEIFGTPEARLLAHWDALDQATPHGREATSRAEMSAAVKQAQADEIARLQREVSIAQTSEADLIDEWYARTGARR